MSSFMFSKSRFLVILFLALMPLAMSACTAPVSQDLRLRQAKRIYFPVQMTRVDIHTTLFPLVTFERVREPGGVAVVYIDGDARGIHDRPERPYNPTPIRPTALKMTAADKSANVLHFSTPCGFLSNDTLESCERKYFTTHRYMPEIVSAYEEALNRYQRLYQLEGFHLVGYGGGAVIAVELTKQRPDVLSLRTVAGVLDTKLTTKLNDGFIHMESLNPSKDLYTLGAVPQHHFIGAEDRIVRPSVLNSFIRSIGQSRCVRTTLVPGAGHDTGWGEKWADLLKAPVDCQAQETRLEIDWRSRDSRDDGF